MGNSRYWLTTLGCPKNQVDSDKLEGALAADGLRPADDAASADLVVVGHHHQTFLSRWWSGSRATMSPPASRRSPSPGSRQAPLPSGGTRRHQVPSGSGLRHLL